ncbi:hypothetical protein HDV02_005817 [Globomyces sp. JEL0801]|nr:hypothetical protein HDV02_005817 [Globomyces sp. JEL0801]
MPTIHVKSNKEFKELIGSAKVTVVDFYADWCGPCVAVAPKIEELSDQFPNLQFLKVNVDDSADISEECEIRAMPTFQFYQSGKKLQNDIVGADLPKINEFLAKHG